MSLSRKLNYVTQAGQWLASFRYRIAIPAKQLNNPISITMKPEKADIYVFSKHFGNDLEHLKSVDGVTVYDVCDNHFDHSEKGEHYHNMTTMVDHVTCNSEVMAQIIKEKTGRDAVVIPDPYESPKGSPGLSQGKVRLCWFGHQSNLHTVQKLDLRPVMNYLEGFEVVSAFQQKNAQGGVVHTPWSLGAQRRAIHDSDIVILPQEKMAKSANRLIEALRLGRFVCANSIPSYDEFKEFAYIGDICDGIRWATEFPEEVLRQIEAGQEYIENHYSPKVIGEKWQTFFDSI